MVGYRDSGLRGGVGTELVGSRGGGSPGVVGV